MLAGEFAVFW